MMAKHFGTPPLYDLKDHISESYNSSLKTARLIDSTQVNYKSGGSFSTNMQDKVECDLSLNSAEIDKSTDTDIKPDIKDLSDHIISNCNTDISNISPFSKWNQSNMESIENISVYMNQDKIKQESTSHSTSVCRVKEEIMYCQSCSYSDMDIVRMKFHIFREHPTGAAVVSNSFDIANCYLYDMNLLCVKESCSFFTSQCDVYEEHLMSCCLLKETLSEDEIERLKSTVKFILDFKNKHNLNTVPGFLDCFSTFNTAFTSSSEGETAVIQSGDDHDVSENIALEMDVAGSPIDINSLKETERNKIREMYSTDGYTKDLQVSDQQSGFVTRMTTETHPVDHTSNLYYYEMKMNRGHFGSDITPASSDLPVLGFAQSSIPTESRRSHTEEKPFSFIESNFTANMRTHTEEKPFKCSECGKTFGHISSLNKHIVIHTGEKPFKCGECGKTFCHNSDLIEHMRTHTGEKPFKCNDCGKTFGHNSSLIKHRRTHTNEKPFKCNECGKTFTRNSILIIHMRSHTGEKPFKCNDCEKTFSQNSYLVVHMRTHTKEKPFKCNECGKTFNQNSYLVVHMRTHTGEKPFKCSECEKTFSQNSHLVAHMRTHTREKSFKCNECGKTFSQNNELTEHRRTHTEEKPFKCNECGKTFDESNLLIKHMRTHTIERPFKCDHCGKAFSQNSALIIHMRTHTGEKPFICTECGKTFGQNSNLIKHRRTHIIPEKTILM